MSLPEIDNSLFLLINKGLQNSFFDILMPFVTNNVELLFLPLFLWTLLKERRKTLLLLAISLFSVALADGSGHLLKDLFARPRPCNTLENINLLVGCGRSFSMPSNHAANAFGFAMVFWFLRKNIIRYLFIFVAAAVGFSRVYVGVHYPFDVFAGTLIGIGASYTSILLYRWASEIFKKRAHEQALYFIILLISLFRIYFILTGPFDLSPDEAHYWEWSRRLDLSYYSKGPIIAYLIYIGTAIFGDNVFGVRILAVIFSALSSILLYRLGSELYDKRTGLASALLIQIVPLYSVYGSLLTIDSPFIFFWILSLFFFHKVINRQLTAGSKKSFDFYWVILGISIGLGLLTKYTMAFFYLSGFLFLLFYKNTQRLLTTKGPYIALVISMIIFSPVIIWNAGNGWVTLKHTAGQINVAEGFKISPESFFEFLGSQIGVITPILIVLIFIAVWRLRRDKEGAFLFWFAVPVVTFFILKSLQGKVQANWALPGYAAGFIAFSAYYIKAIESSKRTVKILVASGILLASVVTAIAHFPAILNLPLEKDPSKNLVGWKELGKEVDQIYREMSSTGPVFIFSDKYQVSSELAFYMKDNPVIYCINHKRRMNQYDLWPGFGNFIGQNAIFVKTKDMIYRKERTIPEEVSSLFESCEKKLVVIKTKQKKRMKFSIFKCYDFKGIKFKPPERF